MVGSLDVVVVAAAAAQNIDHSRSVHSDDFKIYFSKGKIIQWRMTIVTAAMF